MYGDGMVELVPSDAFDCSELILQVRSCSSRLVIITVCRMGGWPLLRLMMERASSGTSDAGDCKGM